MPHPINTDEAFKKTQQIVGRPEVTDRNLNEEYMRNPPHNLEQDISSVEPSSKAAKEQARQQRRRNTVTRPQEREVIGSNELESRDKKEDDLAEMAIDSSIHS